MTITKKESPKLYADLVFLNKAIGKDETRYFLNGLYMDSDKNCMATTDGRRLHIVNYDLPDIAQGIYKLKVTAKEVIVGDEIDGQYPRYDNVIPDYQEYSIGEWTITSNKKHSDKRTKSIAEIYKTGCVINYTYLLDLSDWIYEVSYTLSRKAYTFEGGGRKAIIMPMQID